MYSTPQHSIEEALGKFELIDGQGNGKTTACAMTMLGWLAGHKKWTDHPICANATLAEIVIDGNDFDDPKLPHYAEGHKREEELTPAGEKKAKARRQKLVELGYEGVLDTWWIPQVIIDWAIEKRASEDNEYKRAVGVLKRIGKWKQTRHQMRKDFVKYDDDGNRVYAWVRVS